MGIDTTVLLNIADDLFKKAIKEEEYRSATNRAYYGAYHECSRLANKYNHYPKSLKNKNFRHTELCKTLCSHNIYKTNKSLNDTEIIKLGYLLKQTKDLRSKADYNISLSFNRNQASDALQKVKCILNLAKNL